MLFLTPMTQWFITGITTMKKFTFILVALALVFSFNSCHKEGKFNPSKKIATISEDRLHYGSQGEEQRIKVVTQKWKWNGNKLASIDYMRNKYDYSTDSYTSEVSFTKKYTYEGSRISRIDYIPANNENYKSDYTDFIYDGGKLMKLTNYYDGHEQYKYEFTYKSGKISSMTKIYYNDKGEKANSAIESNPLCMVFPEIIVKDMTKTAQKFADTKGHSITYNIEWDGSNISTWTYSSGKTITTHKYTYDKKKNPFYGFLDQNGTSVQYSSKNNILRDECIYDEDGYTESYIDEYFYEYDGNYPNARRTVGEEIKTYFIYK